MNDLIKPTVGEYTGFNSAYVSGVLHEDFLGLYLSQIDDVKEIYGQLGEEKSNLAYAPGKWTGKEVLGHIIDTDRILGYRALCIARGEKVSLPGFDQDQYMEGANFNRLPLSQLIRDFELSRLSLDSMAKTFDPASYAVIGAANGFPVSLRALLCIIPGHALHHFKILRERYLTLPDKP